MENKSAKLKAWCVHIFTASGMIVGFRALEMAVLGNTYEAFILLFIAAVIDGIDGTFARMARVREVLPDIDGHEIDGMVDCLNYLIVPVVIFYQEKMVPEGFRFPLICGIVFSALYHLSNLKKVTDDYHFRGFPGWWNLIVYYLFILDLGQWANLCICVVFIVLHFVPVHFIYLSRMHRNRTIAFVATFLLLVINGLLLFTYPQTDPLLKVLSVIPLIFLLSLGSIKRELLPYRRYSENSIP